MKAISLWQPWASAIALGLKRIESRGWWTGYRGPLAIHAAKRWTADERDYAAHFARVTGRDELRAPPLGAIVATCVVTGCWRAEDLLPVISQLEEMFGNYAPGRFGWLLAEIVPLAQPIPFKGAQGFFDVPDELIGGVRPDPAQGALL